MQPFVGQIQAFPFSFTLQGWLPCNGQLLPIQQNTALYDLIGITYGGDGQNTFALPKLAPIAPQGPSYFIAIAGVFPSQQQQ